RSKDYFLRWGSYCPGVVSVFPVDRPSDALLPQASAIFQNSPRLRDQGLFYGGRRLCKIHLPGLRKSASCRRQNLDFYSTYSASPPRPTSAEDPWRQSLPSSARTMRIHSSVRIFHNVRLQKAADSSNFRIQKFSWETSD